MDLKQKFNCIITLSITIVGVLSIMITANTIKRYDHLLYETNANFLDKVVSDIETDIDAISIMTEHMISNDLLQSNLMTMMDTSDSPTFYRAKKNVYESISYYYFSNKNITSIAVILGNTVINSGDSLDLSSEDIKYLETMAISKYGNCFWYVGNATGGKIVCVRQVRQKAFVSLRHLGTIIICIDIEDMVSKALSKIESNDYNFVLFDDDTLITPKNSPYELVYRNLIKHAEPYRIQSIQNSKKFIVRGSLPNTKWNYLYFTNYDSIFKGIQTLKFQSAIIIIAAIISSIFLANLIIKKILYYFQILSSKMKHFECGNFEPMATQLNYSAQKDELAQLNQKFDEMVVNFNKLIKDNYIKQLSIKDAQIKMLQQQINPHFLYNTLDSINWMAQSCGAEEISIMARCLGKIFRGTINNNEDFITLDKELEFLNHYIQIQTFRFKQRLNYEMNISDAYRNLQIPKMILQPLVENAIKHGLENSFDPCTIQLSIEEIKGIYQIKVSNTCSEFEENLLEKIESKELIPGGTGVGLTNIDRRLKLIYGENYGLTFYNEEAMAVAVVSIPKALENN